MKFRNLFIGLAVSVIALFMSGCLSDGSISAIEYNNTVVDTLNATSTIIEDTTNVYDSSIPNIVTEESEIDSTAMAESLISAKKQLEEVASVLLLVSKNAEQQAAVSTEFTNYLTLAGAYISTYETVVNYYSSSEYVDNLDLVAEYDENLHNEYNYFIESNNTLVDILASYID